MFRPEGVFPGKKWTGLGQGVCVQINSRTERGKNNSRSLTITAGETHAPTEGNRLHYFKAHLGSSESRHFPLTKSQAVTWKRTSPLHALPRKGYLSVEMWFALDLGPKYFAKSSGLPPLCSVITLLKMALLNHLGQ